MKLSFAILLIGLYLPIAAQNQKSRYSLNLAFSHSIFNYSDYNKPAYNISPQIEILYNYKISEKWMLSTGLGYQVGKQTRIEEINELVWVEDIGWYPFKDTKYWQFSFNNLTLPIQLETFLQNAYINSIKFRLSPGWTINHKLKEEHPTDISGENVDLLFGEFSLGVNKSIFRKKNLSLDVSPFIGYKTYFGNNNWQNGHLFYSLSTSINFKHIQHD